MIENNHSECLLIHNIVLEEDNMPWNGKHRGGTLCDCCFLFTHNFSLFVDDGDIQQFFAEDDDDDDEEEEEDSDSELSLPQATAKRNLMVQYVQL